MQSEQQENDVEISSASPPAAKRRNRRSSSEPTTQTNDSLALLAMPKESDKLCNTDFIC